MPIRTKYVATSTTAVKLVDADPQRTALYVKNEDDTNTVRIGKSDVTVASSAATAGFGLAPGDVAAVLANPQGGASGAEQEWWIVAEASTPAVSVLEIVEAA